MPGEGYVYVSIRNGSIARIEKGRWDKADFFPISHSSFWTMICDQRRIYAGSVDGQLLAIDVLSMEVEHCIMAHKQNLKSLYLLDDILASASQDKSLALWNLKTWECLQIKKNLHKKAYTILGTWQGHWLTVSFPCGEIKFWDENLREKACVNIAPCLTGHGQILHDSLYLASRAIQGIDVLDLRKVL